MEVGEKEHHVKAVRKLSGENMASAATRVFRFYRDGFRSMTVGKTLWKIIIVKLIVMFAVLKIFFFPDFLATNFSTDEQRADHVIEQITKPAQNWN